MASEVRESKALKKKYQIQKDGSVLFEDGVKYDLHEVKLLSGVSDTALNNIHKIKIIFGGKII
jgi:hypothetical protein